MGEALNSSTRKVQSYGGCLYINPTDYGVRTLDIECRDNVVVETYPDRIVIRADTDDE